VFRAVGFPYVAVRISRHIIPCWSFHSRNCLNRCSRLSEAPGPQHQQRLWSKPCPPRPVQPPQGRVLWVPYSRGVGRTLRQPSSMLEARLHRAPHRKLSCLSRRRGGNKDVRGYLVGRRKCDGSKSTHRVCERASEGFWSSPLRILI
jgi:hypothetical protein